MRLRALSAALALCALPALAENNASRVNPIHPNAVSPDDRTATNSIFLEGGGPGLLYSINYERILEQDYGLRIGFSFQSFSGSVSGGGSTGTASASIFTVPIIVSYLGISSGNHVLELGAGGTAVYASGSASGTGMSASGAGMSALGTALIGYRRQPVNGGLQFRVGIEALVGKGLSLSSTYDPNAIGVLPWMYLSFGFSL
jgi:hypothetical protein